ncbi:Traf3-Interacting Jnk-Activating Modulator [Manis pentadactyla]|nr:Traf3-Interacting Jnk-Activating Modulator [Manis pentadactyla]
MSPGAPRARALCKPLHRVSGSAAVCTPVPHPPPADARAARSRVLPVARTHSMTIRTFKAGPRQSSSISSRC